MKAKTIVLWLSVLAFVVLLLAQVEALASTGSCELTFDSYHPTDASMSFGRLATVDRAASKGDYAEFVVGLNSPNSYSDLARFVAQHNGKVSKTLSIESKLHAFAVTIPRGTESTFIDNAKRTNVVRYVEPNYKYEANLVPNDPYWNLQWGPRKIEADSAWNMTVGSSGIIVAVVDTGIDYNHPDLEANYLPGGYDWVNGDNFPMDDNGHGTHVAGIIGADINNGVGIAGLAQVKILAEKVLGQNGVGSNIDVANGIIHAVEQGAGIINLSLGSLASSETMHDAIRYAYDNQVLLIAGTGNDDSDIPHYPAAFPEVLAVTATDSTDAPAWFTNYGEWVELAAPGVDIYSTLKGGLYGNKSGTSMASPHVAGTAALIWSKFQNLTRDQVRIQLRSTAEDLGTLGFDVYYGYGRVNARRGVEQDIPNRDLAVLEFETTYHVEPGNAVVFNATVLNFGKEATNNVTVQLLADDVVVDVAFISALASGATATVDLRWNTTVYGNHNITSFIPPIAGESSTYNNAVSKNVWCRTSINVPADYPSIQQAVAHSDPGETIYVAPGLYRNTNTVIDKSLTLIGTYNQTILEGTLSYTSAIMYVLADNVAIRGFVFRETGIGVAAENSENLNIEGNSFEELSYGIWLMQSLKCNVSDNEIKNLVYIGLVDPLRILTALVFQGVSNGTIVDNRIEARYLPPTEDLTDGGIQATNSNYNIFENNTIRLARICIVLTNSMGNRIVGNWISPRKVVAGNTHLSLYNADDNIIKGNLLEMVAGPTQMIRMVDSTNNQIYQNSFLDFDYTIYLQRSSGNMWDNGYEGNYWSHYTGQDSNGDGIGDTPFVIDSKNKDHYPLMNPYFPGDCNHDGVLDNYDIATVQAAYGSEPGDPNWNPHADINEDRVVDDKDLEIQQENYGETWQTYWYW